MLWCSAGQAAQRVVDTGHPPVDTPDAYAIFDYRFRGSIWEYLQLATRFEIDRPTRIEAAAVWMVWGGGALSYAVAADQDGLPGEVLVAKAVRNLPPMNARPNWVTFRHLGWTLQPGVYWFVMRDLKGDGSGVVYAGAPNPLPGATRYSVVSDAWVAEPTAIGLRLFGGAADGDAYLPLTPSVTLLPFTSAPVTQ